MLSLVRVTKLPLSRLPQTSLLFSRPRFLLLAALIVSAWSPLQAATTLSIGDIAIASANTDAPDGFTFVLLKDVDSSTVIKFTDNSFKGSGSATASNNIRGSENFVVWTSGTALTAGTVIRLVDNGSGTTVTGGGSAAGALSGLSGSGDQIFVYQGSGTGSNINGTGATQTFSGTILYGVNLANSGWITSGGDSAQNSYLPSELNVQDASIALGTSGGYAYTAARTGLTKDIYQAALANTDNWTAHTTNQTLSTTAFTITGAAILHWDANGKTAGTGGSSTWNSTTQSRFSNSAGTTFVHWVDSTADSDHTASFGGTAGTVTVSGGVTASGLNFTTTGYALSGSSITLTGTDPSISVSSGTATINSALAGSAGLVKSGNGTLAIGGTNTYSGTTNIQVGIVRVSGGNALPNSGAVILTNTSGAALELAANETIGALSGGGTTGGNVSLGSQTLTIAGTASTTFGGTISGTGGSLQKTGNSTLTLTAANTYTGSTILGSGTLVVANTSGSATGSGNVQVSGTGTTIQGTGTIAPGASNSVILGTGTVVRVGNAGDSQGQTLTFTPAANTTTNFQTGSTLEVDLFSGAGQGNNTALALAADVFRTGGIISIATGVKLKVSNPNSMTAFAIGDEWKIFDWATLGGSAPTGTFDTALMELPTLGLGRSWDISRLYTEGVIAVAVPEPSRQILFLLGSTFLLLRRRRSR